MLVSFIAMALMGAQVLYFTPPEGWQPARSQGASPYIQIAFVGRGDAQFNPSLNLAIEETNASLKQYVKAVKAIHLSQPETKWLDLGPFQMRAGSGHLIQLEMPSVLGPQSVLQAILVREGRAYILTGACLKAELPQFRSSLIEAFHSFVEIPSLFSPVEDPRQKEQLELCFHSLGGFPPEGDRALLQMAQWEELQALVADAGMSLGGYWQFLVLQEGYQKIYRESH